MLYLLFEKIGVDMSPAIRGGANTRQGEIGVCKPLLRLTQNWPLSTGHRQVGSILASCGTTLSVEEAVVHFSACRSAAAIQLIRRVAVLV